MTKIKRVIIVDPIFKSFSGHSYFYNSALKNEFARRGIPVFILGNRNADGACLALEDFYPCFDDIVSKVFAATRSWGSKFEAVKSFFRLNRQLRECFFGNSRFRLADGDVVFVPSAYIFEILSLGWVFMRAFRRFAERNLKLIIILRFRFKRNSRMLTRLLEAAYLVACNVFLKGLAGKVCYMTDSELLKQEYEGLLRQEVAVCPIPLFPFSDENAPDAPRELKDGALTVAYLGGARYNKGFDLFAQMFSLLRSDSEANSRLRFLVQIDMHPQPKADEDAVLEASRRLKSFLSQSKNLEIIEGNVSMRDYYGMLGRSDIVVLPYRDEAYKSATANILVEAVLFGKVPVVSSNTWMAHELSKCGLGSLIFSRENAQDLSSKVKMVSSDFAAYRGKVMSVQGHWQQFHSAGRLADMIVQAAGGFHNA